MQHLSPSLHHEANECKPLKYPIDRRSKNHVGVKELTANLEPYRATFKIQIKSLIFP